MSSICALNRAKTLVVERLYLFVFAMLLSFSSYSQLEDLSVNPSLSSGIIQTIDPNSVADTPPIGIVQFKIVDMDLEKAQFIQKEFTKYEGEIIGFGYAVLDQKIIVSYTNPIYPNFLLAILDRVNIKGYFAENGSNVYYEKDGKSAFLR